MNDTEYLKLKTKEIGLRLDVLEAKSRGETLDNNKELASIQEKLSGRQQSENISKTGEEHHIGEKSLEVLQQEFKSFMQNFKPETMTPQEKEIVRSNIKEMIEDTKKRPAEFVSMWLAQLESMLERAK